MSTATVIAAVVLLAVVATFLGWALRWLLIDARERRWEKEAADRFVADYRAHIANDRYLRDDARRPE